jgi:rhamnogalacturonan endolyase
MFSPRIGLGLRRWIFRLPVFGALLLAAAAARANVPGGGSDGPNVQISGGANGHITLANGIITANIDTANAQIDSLLYKGHDMISSEKGRDHIYFSRDAGTDYEQVPHCIYTVTKQSPDLVDISCKHIYSPNKKDLHAWDIDVHFVLRSGAHGLYVYVINSHPASYPALDVDEWRMVWPMPRSNGQFLLEKVYVDELRHWLLPTAADYAKAVAVPGAPKEVTQFTTGDWNGKYDCKYVYSADYWDLGCWGYASDRNHLGGWLVFGSHEFFTDGPMKQDLTTQEGDNNLVHLNMNHYGGSTLHFAAGTAWTKFYGPYLIYCNDQDTGDDCWKDAQEQAKAEARAWPYSWVSSPLYPQARSRGGVTGKFVVRDALKPDVTGANAWVGLAQPENSHEGGFQFQGEGYQFWVHADEDGSFTIPNVRPGKYTLYAFTTGAVGEFSKNNVAIAAGQTIRLDDVIWNVPHPGKKIAWEIGIPDRRSTEFNQGDDFFVPMLYKTMAREIPNPLEYYVGKSDWKKDWNYVQSYSYNGSTMMPQRWNIHFTLDAAPAGAATLTLAIAGSHEAELDVLANDAPVTHVKPKFPNSEGGALVRESDHAKYEVDYVTIPGGKLKRGDNTISLVQTVLKSDEQSSIMYDYLNLELP